LNLKLHKIAVYLKSKEGITMSSEINFENTFAHEVIEILIEKKLTISAAESCTGGMFAKMITDNSGISQIFNESYVTYANEAKTKILGVRPETLESFGAVSEETALEMTEGLHRISGSNICVCFTGIAGPTGGSALKPVGLVYIGIYYNGKIEITKLQLDGSRDEVRQSACRTAFELIRKKVC